MCAWIPVAGDTDVVMLRKQGDTRHTEGSTHDAFYDHDAVVEVDTLRDGGQKLGTARKQSVKPTTHASSGEI